MGRAPSHIAVVVGALLLCGCRLDGMSRTPAPERALASEGQPDSVTASSAAVETTTAADDADDSDDSDDEPDLLPSPDEPGAAESLEAKPSSDGIPTPSRYAALDRPTCEAELERRRISFDRVTAANGVVAPLRLTGPLSGVTFRSILPPSRSRRSPYDIYDCRLVLALDDFARILAKHDIVEVIHLSVYRPETKRVLRGPGRRHTGALAIDAAVFVTKDGRRLKVEKHFQPRRIGARPCPAHKDATELVRIACEAGDARLFNVLLTPNYNWAHRNHFHLEVTAGVRWTLVR